MYSKEDMRRMVARFDKRPVELKTDILRGLLSAAIIYHGTTPVYSGVDSDTGEPFEGPSLAQWVVETVAYFAASRYPRAMVQKWLQAGLDLYDKHESYGRAAARLRTPEGED